MTYNRARTLASTITAHENGTGPGPNPSKKGHKCGRTSVARRTEDPNGGRASSTHGLKGHNECIMNVRWISSSACVSIRSVIMKCARELSTLASPGAMGLVCYPLLPPPPLPSLFWSTCKEDQRLTHESRDETLLKGVSPPSPSRSAQDVICTGFSRRTMFPTKPYPQKGSSTAISAQGSRLGYTDLSSHSAFSHDGSGRTASRRPHSVGAPR